MSTRSSLSSRATAWSALAAAGAMLLLAGLAAPTLAAQGEEKAVVPTPPTAEDAAKVPLLKVFPDEGETIFKVDGFPVPRGTLKRFEELAKKRHPGLSAKWQRRRAIEQGIIPIAAMAARYGKHLPEMSRQAKEVSDTLARKEAFAEVARRFGQDGSRHKGGDINEFTEKLIAGAPTLSYPLQGLAFGLARGGTAGPAITPVGVQFVHLVGTRMGGSPAVEVRKLSHVLLVWDPEYAKALGQMRPDGSAPSAATKTILRIQAEQKRVVRKAKVELVDDSLREDFYPRRLRKR